jgi:anhydro-N-acetylmuramic acid kinase
MKLLGIMSGTSLDGIDVVLLEVEEFPVEGASSGEPTADLPSPRFPSVAWRVSGFLSRPYSGSERNVIREATESGGPKELALLHTWLGERFSEAALELLGTVGESPQSITVIGSHGQTVWHEPPGGGERGSSLQLGCPATLAERTGIDVVSDFRSRDLAVAGHGAPLVPWADAVLFRHPSGPRILQNLGGMGNVTWLPRLGDPAPVLAFDTGPGVALLDAAAELATGGDWRYDVDGALASRGEVSEAVLSRLMAHPFFQEAPPRSTGREVFGRGMVEMAVAWMRAETEVELKPADPESGWPDLVATLTAFTARSVGDAYREWIVHRGGEEVFLLGGGARNPALRNALAEELDPLRLSPGEELGIDPDAREAAAFAVLAWAHLKKLPANLPEATGSSASRILGSFTPGVRP